MYKNDDIKERTFATLDSHLNNYGLTNLSKLSAMYCLPNRLTEAYVCVTQCLNYYLSVTFLCIIV